MIKNGWFRDKRDDREDRDDCIEFKRLIGKKTGCSEGCQGESDFGAANHLVSRLDIIHS